ncbi:hypothetical protein HDU96_003489, partial [Phlyctochytrium bullatum]
MAGDHNAFYFEDPTIRLTFDGLLQTLDQVFASECIKNCAAFVPVHRCAFVALQLRRVALDHRSRILDRRRRLDHPLQDPRLHEVHRRPQHRLPQACHHLNLHPIGVLVLSAKLAFSFPTYGSASVPASSASSVKPTVPSYMAVPPPTTPDAAGGVELYGAT